MTTEIHWTWPDPPEPEEGPECPEDPNHGPMMWSADRCKWACNATFSPGQFGGLPDEDYEETCPGSALSAEDERESDMADRGDDD
mgnify:CR=1 FL=1